MLVGLDVAHRAYGGLGRAGRQVQQDAIKAAQDAVIAQLPNNAGVRVNARFKTIPYLGLTVNRRALQALLNAPSVRSLEEDSLSRPAMNSSNGVIGAPVAWSEGFDGSGWAVAVLDSGVDLDHAWFNTGGDKIVAEACYSSDNGSDVLSLCPPDGNDTVTESTAEGSGDDCPLSVDGCGHGTHVAGTVAGNNGGGTDLVGVAPGADIIAVNVFTKFTDSGVCDGAAPCILSYTSDQIKGLEQVLILSAGMDIAAANMSLGGGRYYDQASCDTANGARKLAIDNLRSVGIATVISAGNDSYVDSIGAPGCISSAISVGATTDADNIASFSNIYPQLHLLAPGVSITSAYPPSGTGVLQGTSMAAPHVAGAWAVLKQLNPSATVDQALSSLQNTATLVDDNRPGGIETAIPRINLDLALGANRTNFAIRNIGRGPLTVNTIALETAAAWITWAQPTLPLVIPAGGYEIIPLTIDYGLAPQPSSQRNIVISHDDSSQGNKIVGVTVDPYGGPSAPTNVAATQNLTDKVAVTWDAVSGASYYELHRCNGPLTSDCTEVTPAEPSANFYNDNPPAGTNFYYRVKACNSECSGFSAYALGYRVPMYTVGGSVSGLSGSGLVLQNNGGDDEAIGSDGVFTFDTPLADGSDYEVTVKTQPASPEQICSVTNGSGTLSGANVTNVSITCSTETYTIGGSVSGLTGTGLVLQNNGGDDLPIAADGLSLIHI